MSDSRHKNYQMLNLIGYGLAKFDLSFVHAFGFKTKTAFYKSMVGNGVAETIGTIKNRQDLFDPFFNNKRRGWWQKGNAYLHRKIFIDSLFSEYDSNQLAAVVKLYMEIELKTRDEAPSEISPIVRSKFKQLQVTGQEAELYFMQNFRLLDPFKEGILEDARLFGDGYDFQIQTDSRFILVEIKGLHSAYGSIRLTENEFLKAQEYRDNYGLIVVSNLDTLPKMTHVFDPTSNLDLKRQKVLREQVSYHSAAFTW